MATFCNAAMDGFTKNSANSGAAVQCGEKVVQLPVDRGCIQLAIGHNVGKGAGVTSNKGCHLVLPSLIRRR